MVDSRRMMVALLLFGLMLLTASVAGAAPSGNSKGHDHAAGKKARLAWSEPRVVRTLAPGQSTTVTLDLVSTANVDNVSLRIRGGLRRIAKVSPSGPFSLTAGVAKQVTLTLSLPADAAHSQGGVVKAIVGRHNVRHALKVLVNVPGDTEAQESTAGDDKHGHHGKHTKGQANPHAKARQFGGANNR